MGRMGYGYGSEFHLLRWMGRHRELLNQIVEPILEPTEFPDVHMQWLDFGFDLRKDIQDAELVGLNFLEEEKVKLFKNGLHSWPQKGALMNWDAVGKVEKTKKNDDPVYVLCEAKAHIEEIESIHSLGNSSQESINQRKKAFSFAMNFFGVKPKMDPDVWMTTYYQMANRLYVVALLNEECHVKAKLLNIYFCRDLVRCGWTCPQNKEEWKDAIDCELAKLGIENTNKNYRKHVKNVFLPVCADKNVLETVAEWNGLKYVDGKFRAI